MSTHEDRLWARLWQELDDLRRRLDDKVSRGTFADYKTEQDERMDKMEAAIEALEHAAITPDQVSTMLAHGLEESQARGVTKRERQVRYLVAISSILTASLVVGSFLYQVVQ